MADRFRTTFPVPVTFNDGELPTASKLNGLERQSRQGQSIIGYALGDLWNQAGDSLLTSGAVDDIANMIPNIARYLGPSHRLNPRIPYLPDIEKYTHAFTNDVGNYEVQLPFPSAGGTYTWGGTTPPINRRTTKQTANASRDWYIDEATGYCYFCDDILADWTLTYTPIVAGDLGDVDAIGGGTYGTTPQWNQIPDPDTNPAYNFQGLKIQYVNANGVGGGDNSEGYYIFLPPRMPLNTRRLDHSPQHTNGSPSNSANQQAAPSAGDKLFWQTDTATGVTGVNAEHYRYLLPSIITDHWSQSSTIPTGLLCFYDYSQTKTIVEGITFTAENAATPRKYVVVASGTAFDNWITTYGPSLGFTDTVLKQTDHAAVSNYKAGVRMLCAGTDLSTVVSMLVQRLYDHDHSTASSMTTKMLSHGDLSNLFYAEDAQIELINNYWFTDYKLAASYIPNDHHPQYLHRGGCGAAGMNDRDLYANGMFGDLLFLSRDVTDYYQNLLSESARITFGHSYLGPTAYYNSTFDALCLGDSHSATHGGTPLAQKKVIAQTFGPRPTWDGFYGYSALSASDGYGPVRYCPVPAKSFVASYSDFFAISATSPAYMSNNVNLSHMQDTGTSIMSNDGGGGSPNKFEMLGMRLDRDSTYAVNLMANIDLPYAKYCIVNFAFSVKTALLPLANSQHYFACGYQYWFSGTPYGIETYEQDLNTVSGWTGASSWTSCAFIFSISDPPLVEVDNTIFPPFIPWIRFRAVHGVDSVNALYISPIIVAYRVKEF